MEFLTATQSTWFLIGWIAWPLGKVMDWIFEFITLIGIPNVGIAIILFTVVIKAILIPLSIKQQKSAKLQSIMGPEIQAVQDKYKGKTDNASLVAQQDEMKTIYAKYGTSAVGGCSQLLIQLPILFAFYQVILKMPGYITRIKDLFLGIIGGTKLETFAANEKFMELAKSAANLKEVTSVDEVVDTMYALNPAEWTELSKAMPEIAETYQKAAPSITQWMQFLGMDLTMSPWEQLQAVFNGSGQCWWVVFIPILAGLLQWLTTKLTAVPEQPGAKQNQTAQTMKTMNIIFPLFTVFLGFTLSAGLGIYWVASSAVQMVIQILVNRYMDKVDLNEMIRKNVEKANVKREKKGLPLIKATDIDAQRRTLEEERQAQAASKEALKSEQQKATDYYASRTTAKKGSLAEKAGMVQQYEQKMEEKKRGKKDE